MASTYTGRSMVETWELLLSVLLRVHRDGLSAIDHICCRVTFVMKGTTRAHIQYSVYTHGAGRTSWLVGKLRPGDVD